MISSPAPADTDNGKGGANTTHGTGLKGLTERLTAVDGLLLIDSPTGGPTTITAQLPWRERENGHGGGSTQRGNGRRTGRKARTGEDSRTKGGRFRRVR